MNYSPQSTALKCSAVASRLKCSWGDNKIAMVVANVTTIMNSWGGVVPLDYMRDFPMWKPLWSRISSAVFTTYLDGGVVKFDSAGSVLQPWWLGKNPVSSTWRWSMRGTHYLPTPWAVVNPYNPRAYHWAVGTPRSESGLWPGASKIKVFGACRGTICQYAARNYVEFGGDNMGPEDVVMVNIAPWSVREIHQGKSQAFEFTPETPGIPYHPYNDEPPYGKPALAIFWAGWRPSDFPWYLSSAAAGLSTGEGPKTTD